MLRQPGRQSPDSPPPRRRLRVRGAGSDGPALSEERRPGACTSAARGTRPPSPPVPPASRTRDPCPPRPKPREWWVGAQEQQARQDGFECAHAVRRHPLGAPPYQGSETAIRLLALPLITVVVSHSPLPILLQCPHCSLCPYHTFPCTNILLRSASHRLDDLATACTTLGSRISRMPCRARTCSPCPQACF